tara:strand:+ start:444 stop:611 length:168 start_codon:yes stop_codon:yes gene_type:complete
MVKLVDTTTLVGYGRNNSGLRTKHNSWKRLNGGKNLTRAQMKLLQIRPQTQPKKK